MSAATSSIAGHKRPLDSPTTQTRTAAKKLAVGNEVPLPMTPPSLRSGKKRIDFSPLASPSRRPVTAKPYEEALATRAGAAARLALALRLNAAQKASAVDTSVSAEPEKPSPVAHALPAPALSAISRLPQVKRSRTQCIVLEDKQSSLGAFARELAALHPLLQECAGPLSRAGLPSLKVLRTLNSEEVAGFLKEVKELSALQRQLLQSRACAKK